jgi:prepilin-type processing-associated H-X9-DG protein
VELLVVIAIIAVLSGLLFPVFLKARESARVTGCANNLKQAAVALQAYEDEWDGTFFGPAFAGTYYSFLTPLQRYLTTRAVLHCPSDPTGQTLEGWQDYFGCVGASAKHVDCQFIPRRSDLLSSYVLPWDLANAYGYESKDGVVATSAIRDRSGTLSFVETPSVEVYGWDASSMYFGPLQRPRLILHSGGSNFLFFDGHVHWMTLSSTYTPRYLWPRQSDTQVNDSWSVAAITAKVLKAIHAPYR